MKKILITGGAGFIGSNFIKYMLNVSDYQIINFDNLTYAGNLENLMDVEERPNYVFIKGDVSNRNEVETVFKTNDINYIVHFAAESHVDRSISNPEIFIRTNVLGTQVLLDVAKDYWMIGKGEDGYPIYKKDVKFLHVSTDEVYGALGKTGMFTESTPIAPNSPYSASKAGSDLLVRAYNKTFKLPINITRCSNNYGPFQFPEKLIPLMISNAIQDKKLPVYGDGMQIRDWLHVSDHCSAIDVVLHSGKNGEIYNIGGNNEKANIEIVNLILETLGKTSELIAYVEDRLGHDRRYAIDNSKITSELGWAPSYTFDQGIKETIQWYINNELWFEHVKSGNYMNYYKKTMMQKLDKNN